MKREITLSQSRDGEVTSGEEGADHEAEVNGGHGKHQQEDEHQRGVTVGQHRSVRTHLTQKQHLMLHHIHNLLYIPLSGRTGKLFRWGL